jgi:hypothetical protein
MLPESMTLRLVAAASAALCLTLVSAAHAAVDRPAVDPADSRGAERLVAAGRAATIVVDADGDAGVRRAAGDLVEDVFRVTGVRPALSTDSIVQTAAASASDIVIVGLNLHADESLRAWERSVGDGVTVLTSTHQIASPGRHVLKVWAIDPGSLSRRF